MASGACDLIHAVKTIVDNYMNNRKPAALLIGVYNGNAIVINEKLPVPMELIIGNAAGKLMIGDKVRLLRNDGGGEYYILEIIGRPYQ